MPFCAVLFMLIDIAARIWHRRPLTRHTPYEVIFAGGEGASVAVIATYAPLVLFNKPLAAVVAVKNDKILAWAMACALVAICQHFLEEWSGGPAHRS